MDEHLNGTEAVSKDDIFPDPDTEFGYEFSDFLIPSDSSFSDAPRIIAHLNSEIESLRRSNEIVLVHGIVTVLDKKYSHAWVEFSGHVFTRVRNKVSTELLIGSIPCDDFYTQLDIVDYVKYSLGALEAMNAEEGDNLLCGPWEQRYLNLLV